MKKILYGISGIGNGHANREMPIIEELASDNKIMIFAHDDSLRVMTSKFTNHPNVTIVPVGLTFIAGSPTGLNFATTAQIPQNLNPDTFRTSFTALDKVISEWGRADLVVTDYEPMSAQYAYAYKVPLVTVDQQSKFLYGDLPKELGGFTYADEVARLSMFFPKADRRIACSFFNVTPRMGAEEIMLVPPTIKKPVIELLGRRKPEQEIVNILVYISSAKEFPQTAAEVIEHLKKQDKIRFHLFVPKNDFENYSKLALDNTLIYPHGDPNFIEVMAKANGIISTAGHSLLSEAMFLSIPVYAIPVEPYEQHLNAWAIASNGFGVSETKLTDEKLEEFVNNLPAYAKNIKDDTNKLLRGVGQEIIIDYLRKNFLTDKKKVMVFSPPFSGHLNILKEFIKDHKKDFDFRLVITGWKNIEPDLTNVDLDIVERVEKSDLSETDPALWTLSRVNELLDECLAMVKKIQPDLIIYDFFSLEGNLAGRLLNIPYWSSIPAMIGPFTNQEYRDEKYAHQVNQDALTEIKERHSVEIAREEVEMVSDGFHLPGQINLIWSFGELTPVDFRLNRSKNPFVFVGNLRGDNYEKTDFKNPKPLIYFSLGTVVMNNLWNQQVETSEKLTRFVGKLAELWKDKNFQIIFVTQGKKVLEAYPENWWVYDNVDQVEILSRADLFITHGGSNSFHEAAMQRVPMVVIPFFGDQILVADRVEELGFGINAGGSRDIDTHGSKEFINDQLAEDLTTSIGKMLASHEFAKNYLYLDLFVHSLRSLILGEIDVKEGDLIIGEGIKTPELPVKVLQYISTSFYFFLNGIKDEKQIARKKIDFYATLFRVHVLLPEKGGLPDETRHVFDDESYFTGGVIFYRKIKKTWVPVDFDDVRQEYQPEKIEKKRLNLDTMRVVLTSESPIKLVATERGLAEILVQEVSVIGKNPHLPHDEQLLGMAEIIFATVDRMRAVKESERDASLYVSIVSGLKQSYHQFVDVGVVLIMDRDGNSVVSKSAGLALPLFAIQKAMVRGFKKFTVGKILGEEMASHTYDTDPHSLITQGKQGRADLLSSAVVKALRHLEVCS